MPNEPKYYRKFNYNRNLIPNPFIAELDNVSNLEEAQQKSGLSIGYPGWGLLYYIVLCSLASDGNNNILETGTNYGASTIMIAQALKDSNFDGHIHTIEIDKDNAQRASNHLSLSGVGDLVTQHIGDAKEFLRQLVPTIGQLQVVFLDGSHLYNDVVTEFELVFPSLSENAVVVLDNTYKIASEGEDQRVYGGLSSIVARWGGNLINFPSVSWYTPGMAIWQKQPFDNEWESALSIKKKRSTSTWSFLKGIKKS